MMEAHKTYIAPVLTVYGRLENVTLVWDSPTSTDNFCPTPGNVGSQNLNSGALCAGVGGGSHDGTSESLPENLELIDPELAEEISGVAPVTNGEGG